MHRSNTEQMHAHHHKCKLHNFGQVVSQVSPCHTHTLQPTTPKPYADEINGMYRIQIHTIKALNWPLNVGVERRKYLKWLFNPIQE